MRDHDSDGYVDETHCPHCGGEQGDGIEPQHAWACPWHPTRAFAKGGIGNLTPYVPAGGWTPAGGDDDILDFDSKAADLQPLTYGMGQDLSHGPQGVVAEDMFSAAAGGVL